MAATSRMEFIARTQLTGTAASVSFATGLAGFTKFFLVVSIVNDANIKGAKIVLNNDSGANYSHERMGVNDMSITAARSTGDTSLLLFSSFSIAASSVSLTTVQLSKPVAGEVARLTHMTALDANGNGICLTPMASEWTNTADLINRIDITASANNFAAGTRILLYGSKD